MTRFMFKTFCGDSLGSFGYFYVLESGAFKTGRRIGGNVRLLVAGAFPQLLLPPSLGYRAFLLTLFFPLGNDLETSGVCDW